MERIKALNRFQQLLVILLILMFIVFTIAYFMTSSREGIVYKDSILVPSNENGTTVYIGRVEGENTRIEVTDDIVTIRYENSTYGPYTVKTDSSAIPKDSSIASLMTGVEITQEDDILFRGGYYNSDNLGLILYNEDDTLHGLDFTFVDSSGVERDLDGNPINPLDPSIEDIIAMTKEPTVTHKGEWGLWICGVFVSVLAIGFILFADEIFRFNLSFSIRHVEGAEPSDWEIISRYSTWIILIIAAFLAYITGLNVIVL